MTDCDVNGKKLLLLLLVGCQYWPQGNTKCYWGSLGGILGGGGLAAVGGDDSGGGSSVVDAYWVFFCVMD